jgi:hypothetical protein
MTEKYGLLFDEWNRIAEEGVEKNDIEEWKNVKAIYEHFRSRFIDGL